MTVKPRRSRDRSVKAARPAPRSPRASKSYLALAAEYPIRPITSDRDLDAAIAVLDDLQARPEPLDKDEQGYFDSLSYEIARYEAEAHPMPAVSGAAMLKHLIDAREATLSQVADATGIAVSTLSEVLKKKRTLNLTHIKKLAPYFGVGAAVFVE